MSVKVSISATKESEREMILQALAPVVKAQGLRIKRKPPALNEQRFRAYVQSKKRSCT